MKYIKEYKDGDRIFDIYFCKFKSSAVTKNGKSYDNVIIQDKTGALDAKIWDPALLILTRWTISKCTVISQALMARCK